MVKDPLDNGRTLELPFETPGHFSEYGHIRMEPDSVPVELGPEFKTTLTPEESAKALAELRSKSYSGRHPELGKMFNCPIHGFRHRKFEFDAIKSCTQTFTSTLKDKDGRLYQQLKEEFVTDPEGIEGPNGEVPKKGTLVPILRTAILEGEKPKMKQIMGAAQFVKKRFHPHYSKIELQFIERTREVYDTLRFAGHNMLKTVVPNQPNTQTSKLQTARIIAARQIRKERYLKDRSKQRQQDQSRRINRGLKIGRNRP